MVRAAVFLSVLASGCALASSAQAAPAGYVLHVGSTGKRVAGLQWMLAGHRPSATRIVAYHGPVNGRYGTRTAAAVKNIKWRLGWPRAHINGTAGQFLFDILERARPRPGGYAVRATRRLALQRKIAAQPAVSSCARKVVSLAHGELGVHEIPMGSNDGPRVRFYQAATGAYRAPWCVSFVQKMFALARVGSPRAWAGAIANNSAGAFYVASWARLHGWQQSVPKPAYIVVFLDHLGHVGIVKNVSPTGFTSIEGNASDSVLERFHPFGARPEVFVRVPGCATG